MRLKIESPIINDNELKLSAHMQVSDQSIEYILTESSGKINNSTKKMKSVFIEIQQDCKFKKIFTFFFKFIFQNYISNLFFKFIFQIYISNLILKFNLNINYLNLKKLFFIYLIIKI